MAGSSNGNGQFPILAPDGRADAAAKRLLNHLLDVLLFNQAQLLHGAEDGDYLHDFRVAVRRTRCALGQIKQVFPKARVRRFAADFAALGQMSSAARDWEVYLQSFGSHAQALPEPLGESLAPLQALLANRHNRELQRLKTHLHSISHQRFLTDWRAFLNAPAPRQSTLAHAAQSVKTLADRRIWKIYQRVITEGGAINPQSPPSALHELRKTCKKLRYLLEFFHSLYPPRQHQRLVTILKALQDELGAYQDCQVQSATLLELATEPGLRRAPPATLMAMGALLQNLQRQAEQTRKDFQRRYDHLTAAKTRHRLHALFASEHA